MCCFVGFEVSVFHQTLWGMRSLICNETSTHFVFGNVFPFRSALPKKSCL